MIACYIVSKDLELAHKPKDGAVVLDKAPKALLARRTLSPRAAYVLMAGVIGLALFASGTPSPLYGTYRPPASSESFSRQLRVLAPST